MTSDITIKIAQQAKKWELLGELLQDQEIVAFLSAEFSKNGNSAQANVQAPSTPIHQSINKRGDVIKTVMEVCKEFGPIPFTTDDVLKKMDNRGFVFKSTNHYITVNAALRKLVEKRGFLTYERPGSGRRAARYELVTRRELRESI